MPSTTASVLKRTSVSGAPRSRIAQSSPTPAITLLLLGSPRASFAISSNSFISASPLSSTNSLGNVEHHEIHRVEQRVSCDRSEQVVRFLVDISQQQREQ